MAHCNRYVERAVEQTQAEETAPEDARDRLIAEHNESYPGYAMRAAGEAMQRLTDMLLGLDVSTLPHPVSVVPTSSRAVPSRGAGHGKAKAW